MMRRPTVSKNLPSRSGPAKLPIASGMRYHGAVESLTFMILMSTRAKVKNTAL